MKEIINIVWIKRDIRTQDHASFNAAEKNHLPYLPIYIFEPSILSHPDISLRHQHLYTTLLSKLIWLANTTNQLRFFMMKRKTYLSFYCLNLT